MYKYPVTILLMLLMVSQTFSKLWVIVDFQVNQDYIAHNLCVNRLNIISCCKGTCFLNKSLADDEKQQQAPVKGGQQEETPFQVHQTGNVLPEPVTAFVSIAHNTRHLCGDAQEYLPSFFAPPQAA